MRKNTSICPCQSEKSYAECCEPFHAGKLYPKTAEELMRSRYSAFVNRCVEYLASSHHPDTRSGNLENELAESIHESQWVGLKILRISGGTAKDKTGKVEFEASFIYKGKHDTLHEHSRFKRHRGKWKYLDGKG